MWERRRVGAGQEVQSLTLNWFPSCTHRRPLSEHQIKPLSRRTYVQRHHNRRSSCVIGNIYCLEFRPVSVRTTVLRSLYWRTYNRQPYRMITWYVAVSHLLLVVTTTPLQERLDKQYFFVSTELQRERDSL